MSVTAATKKKQMSREQRRESVLRAARKVFLEQGYGGASMRNIAAEAGVNEAMLYRICASKKELFEEAVAVTLEETVSKTVSESLLKATDNPDAQDMRDLARHFIQDLLYAMREIAPLLNAVLLTDHSTGADFYRNRFEPALKDMVAVIESNLGNWPHREFDPDFMMRAIYGMCWYMAIDERFRAGEKNNVEAQATQMADMIFDGLFLSESR